MSSMSGRRNHTANSRAPRDTARPRAWRHGRKRVTQRRSLPRCSPICSRRSTHCARVYTAGAHEVMPAAFGGRTGCVRARTSTGTHPRMPRPSHRAPSRSASRQGSPLSLMPSGARSHRDSIPMRMIRTPSARGAGAARRPGLFERWHPNPSSEGRLRLARRRGNAVEANRRGRGCQLVDRFPNAHIERTRAFVATAARCFTPTLPTVQA